MTMKEQILSLKQEKNAVIFAHYYQEPEIQDIADYVGDSLALAKIGANVKAELVIVCGVKFMAETTKILSPDKKVLIPNEEAGCPMADMVSEEALVDYKKMNPDRYIVAYVNTTARVKCHTDVCVTSSNALHVLSQVNADKIMFLPDKNLGGYIQSQLPHKDIELWEGYCPIHHELDMKAFEEVRAKHPDVKVLAHPECQKAVVDVADYVGSTKGILEFAKNSDDQAFIIATEEGILYPLSQENPDKTFYRAAPKFCCTDMKKINLDNVYTCLKDETGEVFLTEETVQEAVKPLDEMLKLSK